MPVTPDRKGLCMVLCLLILACPWAMSARAEYSRPQVLILNSYSQGCSWVDDEMKGFLEAYHRENPSAQDPMVEYMDWARYPEKENLKRLFDLYRYRYSGKKLDEVVTFDDQALAFALEHRAELFPGAYVIFAGVSNFNESLIHSQDNIAGVVDRSEIAATLEIMLRLNPAAKRILVVLDSTKFGNAFKQELNEQIPIFKDRLSFQLLQDVNLSQVLLTVEGLDNSDLVLCGPFSQDRDGKVFNLSEATAEISSRSRVPVYGLWDYQLGHGIVGGKLISGRVQGEEAAALANKVLNGEKPPKIQNSSAVMQFDLQQMNRFGIALQSLPKGSETVNVPVSIYEQYNSLILALATMLLSIVLGLVTISALNIKQRSNTKKELREGERKYRELAIMLPQTVFELDVQGNIVFINHFGFQVLGYTSEDLKAGLNILQVVTEEDKEKIDGDIKLALQGSPQVREYRLQKKDGSTFPAIAYSIPIIKEGRTVGLRGIFLDISERKRTELALKESENKFKTLFNSASDAIFIHDLEGHFFEVNQVACDRLGYTRDELIKMRPQDIGPLEQAFQVKERIEDMIRTGHKIFESAQVSRDGTVIPVEMNARLIDYRGTTAILCVSRDITKRKQAEEMIRASLKEKEVLLKEVHHRVKNNLQIISSLLSIQSRYTRDEKARETLQESQNRIRSMAMIHEGIYRSEDMARIDMARYALNLAKSLLSSYGVRDKITLRTDLEEILQVVDKAVPCGLIINELIVNSIKHAFPEGQGGEIHLSMRSIDDMIVLIVGDNGRGIPEDLDLKNANTMGLTLIHSLVNQLHGTIVLDRRNGTEFKITFPK